MQNAVRIFARVPWIAKVALMIAPVAILWSLKNNLAAVSEHRFWERDFTNFWLGARLLLAHKAATLFEPDHYIRAYAAAGFPATWGISFSYPPSILPLIVWLGALPYRWALLAWSLLGLIALYAAAWPHSKKPWIAAAILVSPSVVACLDFGQNGLFTSALFVGALARLDRRPLLAGALIGLLTFKPHLGILLPVALLAARRWRAVAAATGSAVGLFALSLILAGPEAWRLYITETVPYQGFLYHHSDRFWGALTPSPMISTLSAGGSWQTAFLVQGAVTFAMVALVAWVFAKRGGRPFTDLDRVLLLGATFLASPYGFNYDMGALGVCLLMASNSRPELDTSAAWRWGALSLWSAPILMALVGAAGLQSKHHWPPVGMLMLAAGLGLVLWVQSKEAILRVATFPRNLKAQLRRRGGLGGAPG